jgi:hypothetical protein
MKKNTCEPEKTDKETQEVDKRDKKEVPIATQVVKMRKT